MKQSKRSLIARIICTAFVIIMALSAAIPAAAASDGEYVDIDRTGTITFSITSSETEEYIGGGSIAMYKVASVDEHGVFTLLPEYATLDVDVNALEDTDESWSATAEAIALYIKNHGLEDTAQIIEINDHGQAVVTGVETGLYVAIQHEAPKGYNPFKPFIIPFPYDNGEEFKYELIAKPKGTSRLPAEDCVTDLPAILKTVTGDGAPKDTEFKFKVSIYEEEGNYPSLVNKSGSVENGGNVVSQTENEIVLRTVGGVEIEIGTVTFDHPADYFFTVSEINTGLRDFIYDKTVYWAKYQVRLNSDQTKLIIANIEVKYDNAHGDPIYEGRGPIQFSFGFENKFRNPPPDTDSDTETQTPPPPDTETNPPDTQNPPPDDTTHTTPDKHSEKSPQTGQVWWPVMVFSVAGIMCIIIGVSLSRRSRRRRDND